jgi:hypothetical protein|tara:strand:- start:1229 stop:1372 length:144 start_codon:yes stop_codon:yes gene_type:complete
MPYYHIYETRCYEIQADSKDEAWQKMWNDGEDHCSVIENSIEEVSNG